MRVRRLRTAAVVLWAVAAVFASLSALILDDSAVRNTVLGAAFAAVGIGGALFLAKAHRRAPRVAVVLLAMDLLAALMFLGGSAYRVLVEGYAAFG